MLAEDPSLRQLHDELRAIGSDLRSLARHKLDHDLSGAVLRRAEQSVLRGSESRPVAGTIRPELRPASWWKRGAGWRRLVWPAAAVAAALAILIYDAARRPAERGVAQAPAQDESDADFRGYAPAGDVEAEVGAAKESPADLRLGEARRSENMPRSAAKPAAPVSPLFVERERLAEPSGGAFFGVTQRLGFECSPKYMSDRTFEKLLDEKKVMWRRVADEAAKGSRDVAPLDRSQAVEGYALKTTKDAPLRATYIVDAPAERLNEIVAELKKSAKRVDAAAEPRSGQLRVESLARRHLESAVDRAPHSVIITLFCPAESSPPVPSEKNP
jgi:hypothetical protein